MVIATVFIIDIKSYYSARNIDYANLKTILCWYSMIIGIYNLNMDLEYKVSGERFTKFIAVGDDEKYFNAVRFMQVLGSCCIVG